MRWLHIPFFFFTLMGFAHVGQAQIFDPVDWEVSKVQGDSPDSYLLIFKATIEKGWKIYGNDIEPGGPVPTDIVFTSQEGVTIGEIEALGRKIGPKMDPFFDMEITWYERSAVFRVPVRVTGASAKVEGYLEFMTCDAERCLPPAEVEFAYVLAGDETGDASTTGTAEGEEEEETGGTTFTFNKVDSESATTETTEEQPVDAIPAEEDKEAQSLWGYLIAGLGSGLVALLTPCVFPMIPLTVSFFTKGSGTRKKGIANALTYAFSIIFIFLALGFFITLTFGPSALNAMASNKYFNLAFFVIFIIFALSFFGAFELTLPSSLVNKADSMSDKGGFIGIFFMAFTLVLVSFSCTMPIVGSLLVIIAESGALWAPLMGLLGFALALAIPFALFAAFPSWLNSLPKSGGWLNTIKVTLGFAEVALAFKFLSVADLAYHWNFLTRDIFMAIWIIVAILLGVYLLGKLRFPGEPPVEQVTIPRLFFSILAFAFAIYLIPGMWGAPVKLLSGIAPPQHYQEFSLNNIQYKMKQMENQLADLQEKENPLPIADDANLIPEEIINVGHCPHELPCYFDLDRGLAEAKRSNKPLLVDFTGWACVNCRKMEDFVWSDPKVWDKINDEYVLVSLYVDDKTPLPEAYQTSPHTGNKVRTVGRLWSDYQTAVYKANAQPFYVLLDHDMNTLVPTKGYTPDVDEYLSFLNAGVQQFRKQGLASK